MMHISDCAKATRAYTIETNRMELASRNPNTVKPNTVARITGKELGFRENVVTHEIDAKARREIQARIFTSIQKMIFDRIIVIGGDGLREYIEPVDTDGIEIIYLNPTNTAFDVTARLRLKMHGADVR